MKVAEQKAPVQMYVKYLLDDQQRMVEVEGFSQCVRRTHDQEQQTFSLIISGGNLHVLNEKTMTVESSIFHEIPEDKQFEMYEDGHYNDYPIH